jgi:Flp pilus assembly protein TadB
MNRTHGYESSSTGAQQAINSMAVTVGGIYLATHSVTVTVVGTTAATLLTAWTLWLRQRQNLGLTDTDTRNPSGRPLLR